MATIACIACACKIRMLLRILVEDEKEILFNADCQVALLLDSIKKSHDIPRAEVIDLCTMDGILKDLYKHENENALSFFKSRELCLVVIIQNVKTEPVYTPFLKKYKYFEALLNERTSLCKTKNKSICTSTAPRGSMESSRLGSASGKKKRRSTRIVI